MYAATGLAEPTSAECTIGLATTKETTTAPRTPAFLVSSAICSFASGSLT